MARAVNLKDPSPALVGDQKVRFPRVAWNATTRERINSDRFMTWQILLLDLLERTINCTLTIVGEREPVLGITRRIILNTAGMVCGPLTTKLLTDLLAPLRADLGKDLTNSNPFHTITTTTRNLKADVHNMISHILCELSTVLRRYL